MLLRWTGDSCMLFGRLRGRRLRGGGVCFEGEEGGGGCMCLTKGSRCWRRRKLGRLV
jgi:hypothetical protein